MQFLDKWERKLGWISFPGLLRYYALFHVLVFLLQFVNPYIGTVLGFDLDKIMAGEVWRLVTFLVADSGFRGMGAFGMLFLFFMVMIAFMMSDALESVWGVFRTSVYFYVGFLGLLIANFLYAGLMPGGGISSGIFIYTSAFLSFATLFPRREFLMFLIIPVQVRWLAILATIPMALAVFEYPASIGYFLLGFGNYILWAGIPAMRGKARVAASSKRRKKFEKTKLGDETSFHRCKKCGRTEVSDPDLEFRMTPEGEEYCEEHLDR